MKLKERDVYKTELEDFKKSLNEWIKYLADMGSNALKDPTPQRTFNTLTSIVTALRRTSKEINEIDESKAFLMLKYRHYVLQDKSKRDMGPNCTDSR